MSTAWRPAGPIPKSAAHGFRAKGSEVADLVITVSEAMKQELAGQGCSGEKIRVCYHGVDC